MPIKPPYHKQTLPKDSRTIPLYGSKDRGDGLDFGKYFTCWFCGFTCDVERDALGDAESRLGISFEETLLPSFGPDGTDSLSSIPVLSGPVTGFHTALELDAAGDPKGIVYNFDVKGIGCPLCHGLNWRGDY